MSKNDETQVGKWQLMISEEKNSDFLALRCLVIPRNWNESDLFQKFECFPFLTLYLWEFDDIFGRIFPQFCTLVTGFRSYFKVVLWAQTPRAADFGCRIIDNELFIRNPVVTFVSEMNHFLFSGKKYTHSGLLSL